MSAGRALVFAALALAAPACGEVAPQPGPGDPHIQSVAYDPQQVVVLHLATGYAVTLVFAPDERIETVTVGDSGGWQVQADRRADRLVVKAIGAPAPSNLTVLSDARTYNFTLTAAPGDGVAPYLVAFAYPPQPGAPAADAAPARYRLHGARALWPAALSDDGAQTVLRWPGAAAIPVVYGEDARRGLQLVNGAMRGADFVIDGVYPRLVFVLGRDRAGADRLPVEATP